MTSARDDDDHGLQLQVYTAAGRREGLDVRGAYIHDLKAARADIVSTAAVITAEVRSQRRPLGCESATTPWAPEISCWNTWDERIAAVWLR